MALIASYCSFFNSRLGFPNFVTENSIVEYFLYIRRHFVKTLTPAQLNHYKNLVIRNALSQSLVSRSAGQG